SINLRELKITFVCTRVSCSKWENSIKIYSDNMTALKYMAKSGGTISRPSDSYTRTMHSRNINTQADRLSRLGSHFKRQQSQRDCSTVYSNNREN
ncbi:hypothetical protein BDF20DRAFT_824365, partial [Mycotypha africana]|uniref:uncharacterized protein n=1 Tax=Mycotypha africana TaxID=64632 RepID=UPI0022FFCC0C